MTEEQRVAVFEKRLTRQLIAAIDGAISFELYAQALLGRRFRFSPEDMRALAIVGFEEESRRRSR